MRRDGCFTLFSLRMPKCPVFVLCSKPHGFPCPLDAFHLLPVTLPSGMIPTDLPSPIPGPGRFPFPWRDLVATMLSHCSTGPA